MVKVQKTRQTGFDCFDDAIEIEKVNVIELWSKQGKTSSYNSKFQPKYSISSIHPLK